MKLVDTQSICPTQVIQDAVAWAIPSTLAWREGVRATTLRKIELFRQAIAESGTGWTTVGGDLGGYFVFLRHPFETASSEDVAKRLLQQTGVCVLPASYFCPEGVKDAEMEHWLRVSVPTTSEEALLEAASRIVSFRV